MPYTDCRNYPTVSQFKELIDQAKNIAHAGSQVTKDYFYQHMRILSISVSKLQDSGYMKVLIESGTNYNPLPAVNAYSLVVSITHMYLMEKNYCKFFDTMEKISLKDTIIDLITKTINNQTQIKGLMPKINRIYIETLYHLNRCGLYTQRVLQYPPSFGVVLMNDDDEDLINDDDDLINNDDE
jgi:hypothetical protein